MSDNGRPQPVGLYDVLQDFETRGASIRVLRMEDTGESIETVDKHIHNRSAQTYVAVEGRTAVYRDGIETVIGPYQALTVSPGTLHGARPLDPVSVVINISIPPLAADDQVAVLVGGADLMLPTDYSDVED